MLAKRSHRKHLSREAHLKRGPSGKLREPAIRAGKSSKQLRSNVRAKLRRTWL